MAILAVMALAGCRQKEGKNGEIDMYRSDFATNAEMSNWQWEDSGQWEVSEGWLTADARQTTQTRTILWLKRPMPDDVQLEFEGECLDHAGELNCYLFGNGKTLSGYEIVVGSENRRIAVYKIARDGDETSRERLGRESVTLDNERPYAIKIKRYRGAIRLYVNEDLLIDASDAAPIKDAAHRYFGFSTTGNRVRFDNLKIESKK